MHCCRQCRTEVSTQTLRHQLFSPKLPGSETDQPTCGVVPVTNGMLVKDRGDKLLPALPAARQAAGKKHAQLLPMSSSCQHGVLVVMVEVVEKEVRRPGRERHRHRRGAVDLVCLPRTTRGTHKESFANQERYPKHWCVPTTNRHRKS